MDRKLTGNICKWVSVVLVALAVILMFRSGVVIADRDDRRTFQKSMRSALKEMDYDKDELDDLQDRYEEIYDTDLNIKKIYRQLVSVAKALKDGAITPSEMAFKGPELISLINTAEDEDLIMNIVDNVLDEDLIDGIDQAKAVLVIMIILFYVTVALGIVVIILHIKDNPLPGISVAVLTIIWAIIMGVAASKLNYELDDDLFKISGGMIWAVVFAVLAAVIWYFKDVIAGKLAGDTAAGLVCPSCGGPVNPGAQFCPNCGTRLFAEAAPASAAPMMQAPMMQAPVAQAPVMQAPPVPETPKCPSCGMEVTDDSVFCPGCGTKLK